MLYVSLPFIQHISEKLTESFDNFDKYGLRVRCFSFAASRGRSKSFAEYQTSLPSDLIRMTRLYHGLFRGKFWPVCAKLTFATFFTARLRGLNPVSSHPPILDGQIEFIVDAIWHFWSICYIHFRVCGSESETCFHSKIKFIVVGEKKEKDDIRSISSAKLTSLLWPFESTRAHNFSGRA